MTKILINPSIGGFNIPREYAEWLVENKGWTISPNDETDETDEIDETDKHIQDDPSEECYEWGWSPGIDHRTNPDIVEAVEKLGNCRSCVIIEIPNDVDWYLEENECGIETVWELSRSWYFEGEIK